jgi:glutathione synthase/RimK-type ligase-like ATP-grasp enzyme
MKVALVTSAGLAHPDIDLPPLVHELSNLDVEAEIVSWDADVDWSMYEAAIIRSTWDYHRRLDEFDHWLTEVATHTQLWNPVEVIRWNLDKRYLVDLAANGLPIVPSEFVDSRQPNWQQRVMSFGSDIVVKPAVGAGSHGVRRFTDDQDQAINYVHELIEHCQTPLIQRYLHDIDTYGEVGLVTAGGALSHAFHKAAILDGEPEWSGDDHVVEVITAHLPSDQELALCERVLAALPPTAYARIDLLPTNDGPVISEVELIEPSLFLDVDAGAAQRIASAFASLLRR